MVAREPQTEARPDAQSTSPRHVATPLLLALAASAACAGAVGGALLAARNGPATAGWLAGLASVVWAAVRLLLMRLTSRGRVDADAVYRAWALGSLVLVLGLTPETRLAVWVVAAVVTWIALVRHGASRPSASRLTGIAWGAQALVVVVSWLAESAILALLAVTS